MIRDFINAIRSGIQHARCVFLISRRRAAVRARLADPFKEQA